MLKLERYENFLDVKMYEMDRERAKLFAKYWKQDASKEDLREKILAQDHPDDVEFPDDYDTRLKKKDLRLKENRMKVLVDLQDQRSLEV